MKHASISSKILLGKMGVIEESSRSTGAFQDPKYFPFYFYVGREFNFKDIFCVGLELGLQMSCLLQGCENPNSAFCVQFPSESFYSPRVATSNIKTIVGRYFPLKIHIGELEDSEIKFILLKKFNASIITVPLKTDKIMNSLDFCWNILNEKGVLLVDKISEGDSEKIILDFCKVKNVKCRIFETRYKAAIIIKE